MGYYVSYEFENVKIKKENEAVCLKAINDLFKGEVKSYTWTDSPGKDGYETLTEAFEAWRFGISYDENIIYLDEFNSEKLGSEDILFDAIAPFVESDGFIYGRGEDGEMWRFAFVDGKCIEQHGKVTYD